MTYYLTFDGEPFCKAAPPHVYAVARMTCGGYALKDAVEMLKHLIATYPGRAERFGIESGRCPEDVKNEEDFDNYYKD